VKKSDSLFDQIAELEGVIGELAIEQVEALRAELEAAERLDDLEGDLDVTWAALEAIAAQADENFEVVAGDVLRIDRDIKQLHGKIDALNAKIECDRYLSRELTERVNRIEATSVANRGLAGRLYWLLTGK
jgi:chromosome segregation ATPase